MTANPVSPAIKLPRLLFATQHTKDDYGAPDMQYGDLSAGVLRQQYHLRDISARMDPFTHPNREESARVELISKMINKCIIISKEDMVNINFDNLLKLIYQVRLPKFDSVLDRANSLGTTVHDIWATHIFLDSFELKNNRYITNIRFKFQYHFGLDTTDISNTFYLNFRIFRIWFVLQ